MPKGIPKTEGEKLKDKFDTAYGKMKGEFKKGRSSRKSKGKCGCEQCKKK
jgi:hypothetical protein